ncbi:MAG: type II secretion system F family protein [Armatimonadota bacterium]
MPNFRYVALDLAGRQVTGEIQGSDTRDVAAKLREKGCYPVEIAAQEGPKETQVVSATTRGGRRITRGDVTVFTRQLSDLISGGLPLDRCLTVLIEQSESKALQELLTKVQAEVRSGSALSAALAAYPKVFPEMYTNMLRAGEASGQLPEVAQRLADFLEKEQVRRSQVISALVYPAVLLSVAVTAVAFLLTFVIPRLSGVFEDLGQALPTPTVILLSLAGFLGKTWWIIALAVVGGVFVLKAYTSTDLGRRTVDALVLRTPLIGRIVGKVVISRFARAFGTLLAGGVSLLEALEIAGEAAGSATLLTSVRALIESARQGEALAHGMRQTGAFPPVLIHMTAVGEETGDLPRMLTRVADSMDFEVDASLRRLTTLLEPAIVLGVGGFVGFVVLSILLPIFQANAVVR